jgi:hypothetical protein
MDSNHNLLGKNKNAVVARYGVPDPTSTEEGLLNYRKALDRPICFEVSGSKVLVLKVFQKDGDSLNVEEVIKRRHPCSLFKPEHLLYTINDEG